MKKYTITVNGTAYEVEVEEMGGVAAKLLKLLHLKLHRCTCRSTQAAPAAAPAPAAKPVAAGSATIQCSYAW